MPPIWQNLSPVCSSSLRPDDVVDGPTPGLQVAACLEELQQAAVAVQERQSACDAAKVRLVGLLATTRTLSLRYQQASATFLDLIRSDHPSPIRNAEPSAASSAVERTTPPPAPPGRVDAALYPDAIALTAGASPSNMAVAETPVATSSDSCSGPGGYANWSTGDQSGRAPGEPEMEVPDSTAARQITLRLREARRAAAEAAGVPPAAIRWVLQSPHAAPGGEPLSFTSEFASPECLTSSYACTYMSLLEMALLAAALGFLDEGAGAAGDGGGRDETEVLAGGSHATVPSALDTALHGVSNLDDTQLMLRCGVSGRAPLGPTLQQAVTRICSSGRRRVPRPLWLRACHFFVKLLASMTENVPLASGACPHREAPTDGSKDHAVSACPRCCVIGHILQTLREQMQAAAAGEAWEVEAVSQAEVRARCVDVYSFGDLFYTQCMTDQPVGFRGMMCGTRAAQAGSLEAEQRAMLGLFRQLRMAPEQREVAAEAWGLRVRTCTTLDRYLAASLRPLSALLDLPDLVLGAAQSTHSVRSIRSSGWSDAVLRHGPPPTESPCALDHQSSSASTAMTSRATADADDAGAGEACSTTAGASGDDVCICEGCAATMAGRLLGASARITASAKRALAAVAEVHRRDADAYVEQLRAILMPGLIFTPEQFAHYSALMVQQGAFMDWLWLCKTAADEARQDALFRELHESFSLL